LITYQLIAGNLLLNESVERFILVERFDDVVAIFPRDRTVAVGVEVAIGICIARDVQPVALQRSP
jgi:hypothetical protein